MTNGEMNQNGMTFKRSKKMKYKCINEIEGFDYRDCRIAEFKVTDECITFSLEALIVKKNNSQNTNYTDSYADTVSARFIKGKITGAVKDGYKYYDADYVLINEVPDRSLTDEELKAFPKQCEGAYLYFINKTEEASEYKEDTDIFNYNLGIEFEDKDDGTASDSYTLNIVFEKSVMEWDKYMNRVQNY